ncbi:Hpr(Ser) kinase/phosphatase [Yoonia maricola]|uniref:Hpr(Ser) kinase/phosphatase n=1 Tax=Yoonia maricola TaxID=420999 RepID=A0A2M8W6G4_9RHOB|nr:HPr kinase/phosphatase C-terminal domain-containing protein [Yoonia maricola]PJI86516.1 Hpr(Ser) kinase/phosphatase [Yoonia maricola]
MSASDTLHASCVAWEDRAVLIMGAAGAGKSALALTLMALGCGLVADDRVCLSVKEGALVAEPHPNIQGLIEARGVGILNATTLPAARVVLAVDLDYSETNRLPQQQLFTYLGCDLPLICRIDASHFAPAVLQILRSGWSDR